MLREAAGWFKEWLLDWAPLWAVFIVAGFFGTLVSALLMGQDVVVGVALLAGAATGGLVTWPVARERRQRERRRRWL